MKKVIVLAAVVLMCGAVSAQRVQLGARVGVFSQDMELKIADIPQMENVLTDARMGFHVAAVARVRLAAIGTGVVGLGFYLQPEVQYSQNTYRIKTSQNEAAAKVKMQAVDIPVLLSFKVSIVRIQAGPVFNVMYKSPSDKAELELMMAKPTVGYALGASVDIFGGLVIDGRYNGQFKDLQNSMRTPGMDAFESVKGSLSSWSLGLSWLF